MIPAYRLFKELFAFDCVSYYICRPDIVDIVEFDDTKWQSQKVQEDIAPKKKERNKAKYDSRKRQRSARKKNRK